MCNSQGRVHTSLTSHPKYKQLYFLAKKRETTTDKYICQDLLAQVVLWLVTTNTQMPNKNDPIIQFIQNLVISNAPVTPSGVLGTGMAVLPVTSQNNIAPRKAPTNWPSIFTQIYLEPLQTCAATESKGFKWPSVISAHKAKPARSEHDTKTASGGLDKSLAPSEAHPTPQANIIVPRPSKMVILRSLFSICAMFNVLLQLKNLISIQIEQIEQIINHSIFIFLVKIKYNYYLDQFNLFQEILDQVQFFFNLHLCYMLYVIRFFITMRLSKSMMDGPVLKQYKERQALPLRKHAQTKQQNISLFWASAGTKMLFKNNSVNITIDSMSKIRQVALIFGNKFVVHIQQRFQHLIYYFDNRNNVYECLRFNTQILLFQMLTPTLLVAVSQKIQPAGCQIVLLDLQKCKKNQFSYHKKGQNYLLNIYVFNESKLFCIVEGELNNRQHQSDMNKRKVEILHFTYYRFDSQNIKLTLRAKHKIDKNEYLSQIKTFKLNQHSGIGFVQSSPTDQSSVKILIHTIGSQGNPQWNQYQLQNKQIKISQMYLWQVTNICQAEQNTFYLNIRTSLNITKYQNQQILKLTEEEFGMTRNFSCFWNHKTNILRLARFQIPCDHRLRILGKCLGSRVEHLIQIQKRQKETYGVVRLSKMLPVYYVDLFNQRILAIEQFGNKQVKTSETDKNFSFMGHYPDIQLQTTIKQIVDPKRSSNYLLIIKAKNIVYMQYPIQQISTFFMQNLAESCDEDLIYEVVKLIEND